MHSYYAYTLCSWLGRGVIDAPVQVVAERIKDVRSARIWDKLLVVRRLSVHVEISSLKWNFVGD